MLFTFVIPATLTAYLPALLILGLPGPAFLPAWLGWFAPLFAGWIWLLACWSGGPASASSPEQGAEVTGPDHRSWPTSSRCEFVRAGRRPAGSAGPRRSCTRSTGSAPIGIRVRRCGYIGANGAGKSTTIKMITGILVPTSGHVRTCGLDPVPQRRRLAREIGVVFGQRSQLWWDLPLRDSFRILAAIHRLDPRSRPSDRTAELVERSRHRRAARHPGPPAVAGRADARRGRRGAGALARGCWSWTSRPSGWT